jgi:hypothetical protein
MSRQLADYSRHLSLIGQAADSLGVRLIFVTQPSIWRGDLTPDEEAILWLGGVGPFQETPGLPYFTSRALAEAMLRYNQTLLDLCDNSRWECVDVASAVPRDATHFFDDVHFTEQGARQVAVTVATYLRRSAASDRM